MDTVRIFDTTLRDGEQSPGFSMNTGEKLRLARQLENLGVDVIEAGFPIASKGDFEAVRAVAGEVRNSTVAGLARGRPGDRKALPGNELGLRTCSRCGGGEGGGTDRMEGACDTPHQACVLTGASAADARRPS